MVWLFLSVLLVVVVYLAIQFPAFRKALLVCLAVFFIVIVAGAGLLYYIQLEDEKRTELWHLIRPDEIVFTDTVLGQTYGSWKVKGNVTNRSAYETLRLHAKDQSARLSCIGRPLYDDRRKRGLNLRICPTKPNASL